MLAIFSYLLYDALMVNEPISISDLIDRWPTIAEFAAEVGCGYEAARQMRRRERIAPEHWPAVIAASASRSIEGVSFEWLARQRSAMRADLARPASTPEAAE